MVKIRLSRHGKKNDPFYRVVATDHTNKLTGKALDIVGYYHPRTKLLKLEKEAIEAWVLKGASITPAVQKLLDTK